MTNFRLSARRGHLGTVLAGLVIACMTSGIVDAREPRDEAPRKVKVFVHPEKLTANDKLTDGESGKAIEIKSETTFIWVDLMPDARFSHPTEYLLVSADGTRVVKGTWWPILNGKPLFRDGKEKTDK